MKKKATWLLLTLLSFAAYKSDAQQKKTNQQKSTPAVQVTTKPKLLTTEERNFAIKFLKQTAADVYNAVKALSNAQLTFKPAADKWSIEECVKHIASSEKTLWEMVEASLKQTANPEKRADIKATDEALIKGVEDRSHKAKTFAALEPANAPYSNTEAALKAFQQDRDKLVAFVDSTHQDLRNHVSVLPIGTYDAYQLIMLISAHNERHVKQIEEVKADPNYPKN